MRRPRRAPLVCLSIARQRTSRSTAMVVAHRRRCRTRRRRVPDSALPAASEPRPCCESWRGREQGSEGGAKASVAFVLPWTHMSEGLVPMIPCRLQRARCGTGRMPFYFRKDGAMALGTPGRKFIASEGSTTWPPWMNPGNPVRPHCPNRHAPRRWRPGSGCLRRACA